MDVLEATCKVSIDKELAKNPALDRQMIQSLQDWARKQPHLPPILGETLREGRKNKKERWSGWGTLNRK
jgi:hypothetical protein